MLAWHLPLRLPLRIGYLPLRKERQEVEKKRVLVLTMFHSFAAAVFLSLMNTGQSKAGQDRNMAVVSSEDESARLVRPKDAAISCSHFWAHALIVTGLACIIVGAIIFSGGFVSMKR